MKHIKKNVDEPEGGSGEAVEDAAVDLLLVGAVLVVQAELGDDARPEDGGEPLSEGDVLHLSSDQSPRLLVHNLVQLHRVNHLHCMGAIMINFQCHTPM